MTTVGTVYLGTWINWTEGRIAGSTLTVSTQNGAYLVAFLALFVRVAGNHFWRILCYSAFQFRSTTEPQDGLHHQLQAILRNNVSDFVALIDFAKTGRAWGLRPKAKNALFRAGIFGLLAFLHIGAFAVAGIFSSRVTQTSSDVLLIPSSNCGTWPDPMSDFDPTNQKVVFEQTQYQAQGQQRGTKSAAYVTSCSGLAPDPDRCLPLTRQTINFTTEPGSSCPFEKSACRNQTSVRFDTGKVDSHMTMGINSPATDRIAFRRVLECAPITTQGFVSDWLNHSSPLLKLIGDDDGDSGEQFLAFYYGPSILIPAEVVNETAYDGSKLSQPTYLCSNESMAMPSAGNQATEGYWLE